MAPKYLTLEGFKKIKKELKDLKENKRKEIAARLEKCIAFGDLSENAEYHETKEEQGFIEGRILELEDLMSDAVIASPGKQSNFAQIGSTVLVSSGSNEETFTIVGVEEGNPMEYKISVDSPLGKALVNQRKGAMVEVETPGGKIKYKILKIA